MLDGAAARAGRHRRRVRLAAALTVLVVLAAGITAVAWGRTGLLSQPRPATTRPDGANRTPAVVPLPSAPPATALAAGMRVGTGLLITGDHLWTALHRWYRLPVSGWAGLSPDGRYLVQRQTGALVVHDLTAGTARTVPTAAKAVAGWSQNSRWALLYDGDDAQLGADPQAIRLDLSTGRTVPFDLTRLPAPATPGLLLATTAGGVLDDGELALVRPSAVPPAPAPGVVTFGPVAVYTVDPVTGTTRSRLVLTGLLPWRSTPATGGARRAYAEGLAAWLTAGDRQLVVETGTVKLADQSRPPVWHPTGAGLYDLSTGHRAADLTSFTRQPTDLTTGIAENLAAGGRTLTAVRVDGATRYRLLRVDPATGQARLLADYIAYAPTVFPGQPALPDRT